MHGSDIKKVQECSSNFITVPDTNVLCHSKVKILGRTVTWVVQQLQVYRVTHHVVILVPLTSNEKLHFCIRSIQGDHSACDEPPVDFKTKVPFWPGLA